MTNSDSKIKQQLIDVSQDYLGPAAERFIDRQVSTHLKKSAELLTLQDVSELIEWLKLSLALLTKNAELVEEYVKRLHFIAEGQAGKALGAEWQR